MSAHASTGRGWCAGRIRRSGTDGRPGVQGGSSGAPSPLRPHSPPLPHEIPAAPESRYNSFAIPRVLPCWLHIKRRHHPIPDGQWDRALSSRSPSRPPTPTAVRAGGRVLTQVLYSNQRRARKRLPFDKLMSARLNRTPVRGWPVARGWGHGRPEPRRLRRSPRALAFGASASFSPASVSGSTTMTVTTGASMPAGTYTIPVTAATNGISHTTQVTLVVQPSDAAAGR
jgi:hypothetical protein